MYRPGEQRLSQTVLHYGRKRALQHRDKCPPPPLPPQVCCGGAPTPCGGNYWTVTAAAVSGGAGMRTWTVYSSEWHPCCIPSKCQAHRKAPGFSCSGYYSQHTSASSLPLLGTCLILITIYSSLYSITPQKHMRSIFKIWKGNQNRSKPSPDFQRRGFGNVGLRSTRAKQETEPKMREEKGIKRQCWDAADVRERKRAREIGMPR